MSWLFKRPARPAAQGLRADIHGDPLPPGATARLGTGRLQHVGQGNDGLGALAFSPDGALLAGAGRDGRVSLWDAATGRLVRLLDRHEAEVNCLAFSPDGRLLVTGGRGGQAVLWDAGTGRRVYQVEADRVSVNAVAFSPKGDAWAAAACFGPVRLYSARGPDLLCELGAGEDEVGPRRERVLAVAFSPDGSRLATAVAYTFQAEEIPPDKVEDFNLLSDLPALGCGDVMNYILSDPEAFAQRMQQKAENMMKAMKEEYGDNLPGHGFTFGEEGGVARGWRVGEAGRLTVWRLPAGTPEVSWDLEEGAPYLLAFAADGAVLASVGRGVQAWDLASKRRLAPGRFPARWHAGPGFSPLGRTILVSPDGRGPTRVWDAVAGREVFPLEPDRSWGPFAFSPAGDRLAVTLGRDTVELRDAQTGQDLLPLPRHPDWIGGLALAASAPVVAVVSGGVHLWDRETGVELYRLSKFCRLPALSPDGTRLAGVVPGSEGEASLLVWDWRGGRTLAELVGVEPTGLLFLDDATLLVGNALGQVGRYDLAAGKWLKILRGPEDAVDALAVSPCGKFVAAGAADNLVRLWRIDTGESLRELAVPAPEGEVPERRPARLALSPGAAQLAWASPAGVVLLWDGATGKRLGRLALPEPVETWAIGFDARGRCLGAEATALTDDAEEFRLSVWDVLAGKRVLATSPQPHPVTELAFTADRRLLACAGSDRTVLFWDVSGL
jgi:WD40 repeat protein